MKKVAFLLNYNPKSWLGGTNLIKNFIECIKKFSTNKIQPVLIVRKSQNLNDLKGFKNVKIIKTDIFDKNFTKCFKIEILIFGKSKQIDDFIKTIFILYLIQCINNFHGKKVKKRLSGLNFQYLHHQNFKLKTRILRNFNIFYAHYIPKILLSS